MVRFIRLILGMMGMCLFTVTMLRAVQPTETHQVYQVVYGDVHGGCCAVFFVNERTHQANRVRVGLVRQTESLSNISPSGDWKFANVLLSITADYQAYFLSVLRDDLIPLGSPAEEGWYHHWSSHSDVLYWFGRKNSFEAALYRATPQDPKPQRITDFSFGGIRTVQDQPLPLMPHFTPWVLLFWSINALFIAALLKYWQAR